jgi:tRNA U38,U39,U40 pseudouridine synthase TruA
MIAGAQGKISLDYFKDLLNYPQKNVKIFKAPPEGLILMRIDYNEKK